MAPKPGEAPPEPPLLWNPWYDAGWLRGTPGPGSAVGKMLPQPRVGNARGKLCWLDDLLGNDFVLLGDGVDPRTLLAPAERAQWDALEARYLCVLSADQQGSGSDDIVDLNGTLLAWMREHGAAVIAVRPDRFVAAADASGLAVPDGKAAPDRTAEASKTELTEA